MNPSFNHQPARISRYYPRPCMELPIEKALMQQIIRAQHERRRRDAIALYQQALNRPHPPVELLHNLARELCHFSEFDQAHAALLQAIDRQPGYQEVHSMLGHALTCLDDCEKAGYHLRLAIALKPNDCIAWARLSNLYAKMDNREATIEAQRQAVKYAPNHKNFRRRLSELLAHDQEDSSQDPEE